MTAKRTARKKAGAEKRLRTAAERRKTRRILFARRVGRPSKYRSDFHPDDIVAYFRPAFDAVLEPERGLAPGRRARPARGAVDSPKQIRRSVEMSHPPHPAAAIGR